MVQLYFWLIQSHRKTHPVAKEQLTQESVQQLTKRMLNAGLAAEGPRKETELETVWDRIISSIANRIPDWMVMPENEKWCVIS